MTSREAQLATWGVLAGFAIGVATAGQPVIGLVAWVCSVVPLVRWYRMRMRGE